MNGKKAKSLRRLAEQQTVGKPSVTYTLDFDPHIPCLLGNCTRSKYHQLKRGYKL